MNVVSSLVCYTEEVVKVCITENFDSGTKKDHLQTNTKAFTHVI